MKFVFPFLSPLSFVSISQPPIICHVLSSCFLSTMLHFQRCRSISYQDLYAFNFRLGRLQSFVSKANKVFFYLSLAFLLPEALHSLAQPYTTERNIIAQFSLTLRRLMSYIYMEHPFLMFVDHTQRRSTVGRTPLDE